MSMDLAGIGVSNIDYCIIVITLFRIGFVWIFVEQNQAEWSGESGPCPLDINGKSTSHVRARKSRPVSIKIQL